jgi:aminopeptidase
MQVIPLNFGTAVKERADYLAHHAIIMVDELLKVLAQPQSTRDAIQNIHLMQRLYLAHAMGVAGHPKIIEALNDETDFPTWKNYVALKATDEQKQKLAYLMAHGDPKMQTPVLLNLSDYCGDVGEKTVEELLSINAEFDLWIDDPLFLRRLMNLLDEEKISSLGELMAERYEAVERNIGFRVTTFHKGFIDPPVSQKLFQIYAEQFSRERTAKSKTQFYTITVLPTEKDAEIDQISYEEYVDLFFRMCNIDWDKMDVAHRILIKKLNDGKILRITNSDGTDVTMDIEGFTFCNSRVAKNVPGSEVFSAPRRDSTNGKIVAKGRFILRGASEMIENITLIFKNGRIVDYHADAGFEYLKEFIEQEEGTHYLGEIGIGTNPALQQHITNSLMVEKIGGSFHVGVGGAYEYKEYLGEPVHLDNGNRSKVTHVDITCMLVGKEGVMILDGEVIMRDGKWLDPQLSYLNAA